MANPSDKLNQIFCCMKTISESTSIIALRCKDYGIIFSRCNPNKLTNDRRFVSRVFVVNAKTGIGGTGLQCDLKKIIKRARRKACVFKNNFGEEISCKELIKEIALYTQEFTQSAYSRILGVSLFLIGFDLNGPVIYQIDPTGLFSKIKGGAMGKHAHSVVKILHKRLSGALEFCDLCDIGKTILQEALEFTHEINVDVIIASRKHNLKILNNAQSKNLFKKDAIFF